jgi:hypothetical protein
MNRSVVIHHWTAWIIVMAGKQCLEHLAGLLTGLGAFRC